MKTKKLNAVRVWKQLEDFLVPHLALNVIDHVVYLHLLRHSRLEGKLRLHFSLSWLARGVRISQGGARPSIRRLIGRGALRLIKRSKAGHVVQVLLPGEIRAILRTTPSEEPSETLRHRSHALNLEAIDFLQNDLLRKTIHAREAGFCFYCLRHLSAGVQCIDHVIPEVQLGGNSYRNLVSCCLECNSHKGEKPAIDFLRRLYRERRLSAAEFAARLRALDDLAAGKLRPLLPASGNPIRPRGRPRLHPAA